MNTRIWIIAGSVTGLLTLILFGILLGIVIGGHARSTPDFVLAVVACILLGTASIKLLGDGYAVRAIERATSGYVRGVGDTVDRLAEALPKDGSNVRAIR